MRTHHKVGAAGGLTSGLIWLIVKLTHNKLSASELALVSSLVVTAVGYATAWFDQHMKATAPPLPPPATAGPEQHAAA
jgi:hypothetical protein